MEDATQEKVHGVQQTADKLLADAGLMLNVRHFHVRIMKTQDVTLEDIHVIV